MDYLFLIAGPACGAPEIRQALVTVQIMSVITGFILSG